MCTTETTVGQYVQSGRGFEPPGFPQGGDHPVVNVSWKDAKAWCAWLSKREGLKYRLPTDHEWSCAVGIGHLEDANESPEEKNNRLPRHYSWGKYFPPPKHAGNFLGLEHLGNSTSRAFFISSGFNPGFLGVMKKYRDSHIFTAPVSNYSPNNLGIYDLSGNVWEWCLERTANNKMIEEVSQVEDSLPIGAKEMFMDDLFTQNGLRVIRGGSWLEGGFPSSVRIGIPESLYLYAVGFRCVVTH
jgi:formylglycine-generating enzyme required for sulfatase activity